MGIPALDRGLALLEELILAERALKYTELKGFLPGIGDASLNRLLKSLTDSGHLRKNKRGSYEINEKVANWRLALGRHQDFRTIVSQSVRHLSQSVEESAAFAMFVDDHIEIIYSISWPDSINIIGTGRTFPFEPDHAASLAILGTLSENLISELLESQSSKIENRLELTNNIGLAKDGLVFSDLKIFHRGHNRLAIPVQIDKGIGALFLCLPGKRLESNIAELADSLRSEAKSLINSIGQTTV